MSLTVSLGLTRHIGPVQGTPSHLEKCNWKKKDILSVSVSYEMRGSIEEIVFSDEDSRLIRKEGSDEDIFSRIRNSVRVAIDNFHNTSEFILSNTLRIHSGLAFCAYEGKMCALRPMGPGKARLQLRISAFDSIDARNEYMARAVGICDQLTIWTSIPVMLLGETDSDCTTTPAQTEDAYSQPNAVWSDSDWIDGAPLVENRIAITRDQLYWIDAYAGQAVDYTHPTARATRHFAEALRLRSLGQFPETSQTLLVSALEVISENFSTQENCFNCCQLIYKINQIVYEIAAKHLGHFAAKRIKMFYRTRSKFLHSGVLPAWYPAAFGSMPQLDVSDPSGCVLPRSYSTDINLVEFTSFILRAECASWWAATGLDKAQ